MNGDMPKILVPEYDGIVHLSLNTEDGDDSYIEWQMEEQVRM